MTGDGAGVAEDERLARAALTRIVEPGDEPAARLVERYGPQQLLAALQGAGPPPDGVSSARWKGLRSRVGRAAPEADLHTLRRCGGRFVCPGDAEWPVQLDDLGAARPVGLWVCGEPSLRFWALRSVAVVGSRACTEYGKHVAARIGAALAERGWTLVSGAAFGVDGAAHRGTLAVGGATVAVLACGVDVAYPPAHRELIKGIGERGLLVAELPPGDHPSRSRFVVRNRVIAALTRGTLVVEAALRSGSLGTARHAQRLGRHVMGVPGPVTSGLSAGVHELLRNGGQLVTDAAEVVELVGAMGELAPTRRGPEVPRDLLPRETGRVLEAMPAHGATDPVRLADLLGGTAAGVLVRLQELRALGFVENPGDAWQLARDVHGHPIE